LVWNAAVNRIKKITVLRFCRKVNGKLSVLFTPMIGL
jgi:hypothetical protein